MDPMFGLPAVKESRRIEEARNRNNTQKRRLGVQMAEIENELNANTMKIVSAENDARELLKSLHASKQTFFSPLGINIDGKSAYQNSRRSSLPSMSLQEFDLKLKVFKETEKRSDHVNADQQRRSSDSEITKNENTRYFTERGVVKNSGTKWQRCDNETFQNQKFKVVTTNSFLTNASLTKCKLVMKGAYERSETQDIQYKSAFPTTKGRQTVHPKTKAKPGVAQKLSDKSGPKLKNKHSESRRPRFGLDQAQTKENEITWTNNRQASLINRKEKELDLTTWLNELPVDFNGNISTS